VKRYGWCCGTCSVNTYILATGQCIFGDVKDVKRFVEFEGMVLLLCSLKVLFRSKFQTSVFTLHGEAVHGIQGIYDNASKM